MKTVLITGGAGFIGTNFIHYIINKHQDYFVINMDSLTYAGNLENLSEIENHPNYLFIKGDIADEDCVNEVFKGVKHPKSGKIMNIDSVINFAAESHVDRSIHGASDFVKTNVLGTNNLLQAARDAWANAEPDEEKRFIHVSTDEVYGSLGKEGKFTEKTPYNPKNPYAASKAAADHLVRSYYNTFSLPVIITNCSNNFGPYQFPEKLIPLVINNCLNRKPLPIYGKGINMRDWIYVTDHCRALDMVLQHGKPGESYNIGGGNEKQNIDVVKTICEILDRLKPGDSSYKELITFVEDRPGHDLRYAIDYTKINEELGWEPVYSFEDSIEKTIKWYLDNLQWIKNVTSGDYRAYYEKQYGKRIAGNSNDSM